MVYKLHCKQEDEIKNHYPSGVQSEAACGNKQEGGANQQTKKNQGRQSETEPRDSQGRGAPFGVLFVGPAPKSPRLCCCFPFEPNKPWVHSKTHPKRTDIKEDHLQTPNHFFILKKKKKKKKKQQQEGHIKNSKPQPYKKRITLNPP